MGWSVRTCGQSWWTSTEESKRKTLARCSEKHVSPAELLLPGTSSRIDKCLFLVLSHAGNHGTHSKLVAELRSMGAIHVEVVYGVVYGRDHHKGLRIKSNEVVHYGVRHRWFHRCQQYLAEAGPISWVWFLEADACFHMSGADFQARIKAVPQKYDIAWLGWRKIWCQNSKVSFYYDVPFALEGSQAIGMRRRGLQMVWKAVCEGRQYRHFDIMLSQRLFGEYYYEREPAVLTRTHKSIIFGKGELKVRPGTIHKKKAMKAIKVMNARKAVKVMKAMKELKVMRKVMKPAKKVKQSWK